MTAEVLLEPGASKPVASVHRGAPGGLEVVIGWRSGRPISMALRASPAALLAELGRRGIKAPAALRRWRRERRVELLRQAGRWSPARYRLLPDAAALRRDGGLRPLVCDLEQLSPLRSIWAREPWPGDGAAVRTTFEWSERVLLADFLRLPLSFGLPAVEPAWRRRRLSAVTIGPAGLWLHCAPAGESLGAGAALARRLVRGEILL